MTPAQLKKRLEKLGIEAEEDQFMTSALATATFIRQQSPHGSTAFVIGGPGLHEALADAQVTEVKVSMADLCRNPRKRSRKDRDEKGHDDTGDDSDEEEDPAEKSIIPDYVIVGEAEDEYNLENMEIATALCARGARLVGTNQDASDPVEGGNVVPSCGAWISVVEKASGKDAYFPGKPNAIMMRAALERMTALGSSSSSSNATTPANDKGKSDERAHSGDVAMIGDRLSTDVRAGMEAGMDSVLVLTGCTAKEDVANSSFRPFAVLDDIGGIVPATFKDDE